MKITKALGVFFILLTICANFYCTKNNAAGKNLNAADEDMLQHTWKYVYWSSCPQNPAVEMPCYQYTPADSSFFGNGVLYLHFTQGHQMYQSHQGTFHNPPFSNAYMADTLTYQLTDDSTIVLSNAQNQAVYTAKIKTLNDSLLVLDYISNQFGSHFELDSLKR